MTFNTNLIQETNFALKKNNIMIQRNELNLKSNYNTMKINRNIVRYYNKSRSENLTSTKTENCPQRS